MWRIRRRIDLGQHESTRLTWRDDTPSGCARTSGVIAAFVEFAVNMAAVRPSGIAKRPSPQRDDEGLMTHRENRTAAATNHNRLVLAMPIRGQPRITIAACNEAGCRVTEIVERRRSLNARRAEHASLESGGRLPHNNVLWFLHWRPPERGKTRQGRHADTKVPSRIPTENSIVSRTPINHFFRAGNSPFFD